MAGVEAAMLMESAWNVGDAMRLMMHADKTWSGPGGWMKTIKWVVHLRKGSGHGKFPSRLWFILALPSMLVFTAWPLSGLTMEVTQGYLHGKRNGSGAMVTGFSYDNFNERKGEDAKNGALITWKNALDANIPGQGIVYTPEGTDRSQHAFFKKLPNVLPRDDGVTRVFLTSQAQNPIEGKNWGLLLQYNCSIVDKVEDLTILSKRNASLHAESILNSSGETSYRLEDDSIQVIVRNQTQASLDDWVENLYAVMEIGYQLWPNKTALEWIATDDSDSMFTKSTRCYFNEAENATGDYHGIDQEQIFELLLWQNLQNISRGPVETHPKYNYTIDRNITELFGAYNYQDFFLQRFSQISKNETSKYALNPMTAIGVQCKASSSVGTADLNGVRSTYSNFQRTDTPINVQTLRCAECFTADVPILMLPWKTGEEWLSYFFTSSAAPPSFYASYVSDDMDLDTGVGYNVQLNYLQAEQL